MSAGTLTYGGVFNSITGALGGTGQLGFEVLCVAFMPYRLGGDCYCRPAVYTVLKLDAVAGVCWLDPDCEISIGAGRETVA